jgi:hypothetical protein
VNRIVNIEVVAKGFLEMTMIGFRMLWSQLQELIEMFRMVTVDDSSDLVPDELFHP